MLKRLRSKNNTLSRIAVLAAVAAFVFLVATTFGELIGRNLGQNDACYKFLGCTTGFFGYDAVEHFLFGIAAAWTLVWLFKKFPHYSLLHSKRWKSIVTLIATVMCLAVAWEVLECAHDFFRLDVLREPLLNFRLHINLLDQPSNLDTMGDLIFTLAGTLLALLFIEV